MEEYIHDLDFDTIEQFSHGAPKECATQVANSTFSSISPLIFLVCGFKVLKHLALPIQIRIFVHIAVTIGTIGWFTMNKLMTIIIFNVFSVAFLALAHRNVNGYVVLVIGIIGLVSLQLTCYLYDFDEYFLSIRGILMMNIMRLTTVAFKINTLPSKNMTFSQFATYIEYIYYPPFIIFGPYLTYDQFAQMLKKKWTGYLNESGTLLRSSIFIVIGISFAIFSSCCYEVYTPTSQFVEDALTAMSFRYSHYFICLVAQAFILFLGSDEIVSNPLKIEFSRSTLQTVSEWNKPFHTFLHENVFQRSFFKSTGLNVFLTFLVSALLHGIDIQMTLTLLTLGFIAFSETVFRKRLADRFSMCVAAKACKMNAGKLSCKHRHTSPAGIAGIVNLLFVLLSMYHLIFTGMPFTDDYSALGYPWNHTFSIWKTHYFASFVISIIFLVLSKIL